MIASKDKLKYYRVNKNDEIELIFDDDNYDNIEFKFKVDGIFEYIQKEVLNEFNNMVNRHSNEGNNESKGLF